MPSGPDPALMRVLRSRVEAPLEESRAIVAALEVKINMAERELRAQAAAAANIHPMAVQDIATAMMETAKWMTRRRTLIEVWEAATNKVWQSPVE